MQPELQEIREKINKLDDNLLLLLNKRAKLSIEVANIKRNNDPELKNIFDENREQEIIDRILLENEGPFEDEALIKVYKAIFAESRAIQQRHKS